MDWQLASEFTISCSLKEFISSEAYSYHIRCQQSNLHPHHSITHKHNALALNTMVAFQVQMITMSSSYMDQAARNASQDAWLLSCEPSPEIHHGGTALARLNQT